MKQNLEGRITISTKPLIQQYCDLCWQLCCKAILGPFFHKTKIFNVCKEQLETGLALHHHHLGGTAFIVAVYNFGSSCWNLWWPLFGEIPCRLCPCASDFHIASASILPVFLLAAPIFQLTIRRGAWGWLSGWAAGAMVSCAYLFCGLPFLGLAAYARIPA